MNLLFKCKSHSVFLFLFFGKTCTTYHYCSPKKNKISGSLIDIHCFYISYPPLSSSFITDPHHQTFWWVGSSTPTARAQASSTWHRMVQLSAADISEVIQCPKSLVRVVSSHLLTLHAVPPWTVFRPAPNKAWHVRLGVPHPLPLHAQMLVPTQQS